MWKTISKRLNKSSWLRSIGSRGGRGTHTRHVEESTTQEPAISNNDTSSNCTSDPREEDWPTDDSFNKAPNFSDPMSDNISEEYQSREVTRAAQMVDESSEERESKTHTSKWLQELPRNLTTSDDDDSRPQSNKITNEIDNTDGQGCSNTINAQKATSNQRNQRHYCKYIAKDELCGRHELCQNPSTRSDLTQSFRKWKKPKASSLT